MVFIIKTTNVRSCPSLQNVRPTNQHYVGTNVSAVSPTTQAAQNVTQQFSRYNALHEEWQSLTDQKNETYQKWLKSLQEKKIKGIEMSSCILWYMDGTFYDVETIYAEND